MKSSMFKRRLINFTKRKIGIYAKKSYSQCGEDLIVRYIFDVLRIEHPSYLDIGAHHPFFLNNTALLYEEGSRGVNVEADPQLIHSFYKERKHGFLCYVSPNIKYILCRGSKQI